MRGGSQSGLVPVKDRKETTVNNKERLKARWVEQFENVLNCNRVARKDIEEKKKVSDTLDVKEDLFCEEELVIVL